MGKTTLYHPISLHVIRGAAEFCGWKFKTIKQVAAEPEVSMAHYRCEIEIIPIDVDQKSHQAMHEALQGCFMQDIEVFFMRKTASGKWMVDLLINYPITSRESAQ